MSCRGAAGATCRLSFKLTVTETRKGGKLIVLTARARARKIRRTLVLGTASTRLAAGQRRTVEIGLNGTGKGLLAAHHPVKTELTVTQTLASGRTITLSNQTLTFTRKNRHRH